MAGKRDSNLRKGYLAEDIGVNVLRNFSAVASVRVQDDIGVDAYAVLLKKDGRKLNAGDTFGVQFKSKTIESISYDEEETNWFKDLEIPLFFAKVIAPKGLVKFYSPIRWNQLHPNNRNFSKLKFIFDAQNVQVEDDTALIGLNPPILTCTEVEAREDKFVKKAFKIFNKWTKFKKRNRELRKFGIYHSAKWETGSKPEEYYKGSHADLDKRKVHLKEAKPILDQLMFHAIGNLPVDQDLVNAFLNIHEWYKEIGIEEGALEDVEILKNHQK